MAGAAAETNASGLTRPQAYARAAALQALGRRLFFDPSLSASGQMACATCHDPKHAFGPPTRCAVQLGGKDMREPGLRAVPSLKYLQAVPQFTEHYYESDDEGDASVDNGPTGGLTWDGRVDRGRDQARVPLLSPFEMANGSPADVVAQACAGQAMPASCARFSATTMFDDDRQGLRRRARGARGLSAERQAPSIPTAANTTPISPAARELTPQEARGLELFNDPAKGNCANCHRSAARQ